MSDQQVPVGAEGTSVTSKPTRSRSRWLLALLVSALLVLSVGGAVGLLLYDKITKPDTSDPAATVQQFMTAVLVEQDMGRVGLFTCAGIGAEAGSAAVQDLIGPEARASWDTVVIEREGADRAEVSLRLRLHFEGDTMPSGQERWVFQLAMENGWRVCSVARAEQP